MKDTFTNCARELRVAVIGDIMLDVYVDGTVERLSPEAPNCVVLDEDSRRYALGGAANVAHNLASWGVKVKLCGAIGGAENDLSRMRIEAALRQLSEGCGLEVFDINNDNRPCTVKTRYRSAGQQLLRLDKESRRPVRVDDELVDMLAEVLTGVDAIILSDYGKGVLSDQMLLAISNKQVELDDADEEPKHTPLLVDPKRKRLRDYMAGGFYGADVICPNAKEWTASDEFRSGDAAILGRVAHIIVTNGAKGCYEASWDEDLKCWSEAHHVLATPTAVCDPAGAGDTFIAALTVALMNTETDKPIKKDIYEALDVANQIAALTVSEHGIVVPELDTVVETLREMRTVMV